MHLFQKTRAFALIDILTVIALLGILASILIFIAGRVDKSEKTQNHLIRPLDTSAAMIDSADKRESVCAENKDRNETGFLSSYQ